MSGDHTRPGPIAVQESAGSPRTQRLETPAPCRPSRWSRQQLTTTVNRPSTRVRNTAATING